MTATKNRRSGLVAVAGLVVAALLSVTGCANLSGHPSEFEHNTVELPPLSELEPLEDPRAYEGPTTAVVGGPSLPPLAEAPEQKLPVTVTSLDRNDEKEVTVEDASRVIPLSLSGSVGEFMYAFGLADKIVGRDISTNFPGAEDIPLVTARGHSVDAETVLSLNPTLIITDASVGPTDVVLQLRDAGVQVVTVERAVNPETSYRAAQQVADALGVGHIAPEFIEKLKAAIEAKEAEIAQLLPEDKSKLPRIAFLYVRGSAGIFYLFGEGSGADSLIRSIGAIDVAEEVSWIGEKPMTEEALVKMNPDIILVMTKGLESVDGVDGLLEAQQAIALTNAGKNRRIIDVDDAVIFAGGARIPDVLDGVARAVYAPDSLAEFQGE